MPDRVMVTKSKLDSLAEAVGSKSGLGVPLTIEGMEDAVLGIETGIQPSGTLAISKNGTHDVTKYAEASVNVMPKLHKVTVSPMTSINTVIPNNGYDGLSEVTVLAVNAAESTVIPGKSAYTYPSFADPPSLTVENLEVVVKAGSTRAEISTAVPNVLGSGKWLYTVSYTVNGTTYSEQRVVSYCYVSDQNRQIIVGNIASGIPSVSFRVQPGNPNNLYLSVSYSGVSASDRSFALDRLCCQLLHDDIYASQVTVEPIPSNYGLITYNGSSLMVS